MFTQFIMSGKSCQLYNQFKNNQYENYSH